MKCELVSSDAPLVLGDVHEEEGVLRDVIRGEVVRGEVVRCEVVRGVGGATPQLDARRRQLLQLTCRAAEGEGGRFIS